MYFNKIKKYYDKSILKGGNINILNKSNYIDSLKLNDAFVYKNSNDLYVIQIDSNMLMYRGFTNKSCNDFYATPGSIEDSYKFEPIWFSGPEVTLLYAAYNMNDNIFRKIYTTKKYIERYAIEYNIDNFVNYYFDILKYNLGTILTYSVINPVELIDINNIHNIQSLIKLFAENWSVASYNKLNILNRLTPKQYNYITNYAQKYKFKPKLYLKIESDETLTSKDKDFFNKLGHIIENEFRKSLSYGNYQIFNQNKVKDIKYVGIDNTINISKYITSQIPLNNYDKIHTIEKLRQEKLNYQQRTNKLTTSYIDKLKEIQLKINDYEKKINLLIEQHVIEEQKVINSRKNEFKQKYINNTKKLLERLNEIKNNSDKGYIYNLNGGIIIMYKNDNGKYEVSILQSTPKKQIYKNIYDTNDRDKSKQCIFCMTSKTQNYNNMYNNKLAYLKGLNQHITHYRYDTYTDTIIPSGTGFQNIFGANYDMGTEERAIAVPYNHIPTMDHHYDCNENSKNFPPHGSYNSSKKIYNCGTKLYEKSQDFEMLFNLVECIKSGLLFSYLKYGKKHKIADINYDNYDGMFYKFNDPDDISKITSPKIYIVFHHKANSIPHLHMHTYIDSMGENLKKILGERRNNILTNKHDYDTYNNESIIDDEINIDDTDEINIDVPKTHNNINISNELFGSSLFNVFESEWDNTTNTFKKDIAEYKYIQTSGKRIKNNPIQWDIHNPWINSQGIKSTTYDKNNIMHHACSAEYLFKKILGIEQGSERMKHEYIFPEPEYELHEGLFYDQLEQYMDNINDLQKIYNEKANIYINPDKYNGNDNDTTYNFSAKLPEIGLSKSNSKIIDVVNTSYGLSTDEKHISRNSTTLGDNIMVLFMQIALINQPNIGGYYGTSAPCFNYKYGNTITHTEICLFNVVDYPVKYGYNSPYTTCYRSYTLDTELIWSIYLHRMYDCQHQKQYKVIKTDSTKAFKQNLIKKFLNSMVGGKNTINIIENLVKQNVLPQKFIDSTLKSQIITDKNNINKNDLINDNDYIEYTNIRDEYNLKTNNFRITENNDKMCYLIYNAFIYQIDKIN
jgi:hypothetical protein